MNWLNQLFTDLGINVAEYPPLEIILLGFGFIFWILAYYGILKGVRKYKIVEIPMLVVAMDIAWEFNWAFLLENNFGRIFSLGCAAWFFMDCFINYYTLRYGKKLVTNRWISSKYLIIWAFVLIGSFIIIYFMRELAEDNGLGVISAYLINLNISALYLYQLLNYPEYRNRGFSYNVAWYKFLGTGFITIVCFMHWSHNWFLLTMCTMVVIMDVTYIYLFKNYKPTVA